MRSNLVEKAKTFAEMKHKGQMRKFENKPYFIHPERVAHILYQFKISKNISQLIAAAYLHDTLEDTNTTIEEIRDNFGDLVASIVLELTSDKEQITQLGKKEYLANKMAKMSSYALTLKLADRIDNVNKLNWQNDKFKNKYKEETYYILDRLKKERRLSNPQKNMVNEILTHLNENKADDDIDYLSFDSYLRRGKYEKN